MYVLFVKDQSMVNIIIIWVIKSNKINKITMEENKMAKKSRGGRMTAAKRRAAKKSGGKGMIKNRPIGKNIMRT